MTYPVCEEKKNEVGKERDGKHHPEPICRGLVNVDVGDARVDGDGL